MSESPFKLNRTRIFILAMGAVVVLIAISMMMGGLGQYQALREAAKDKFATELDELKKAYESRQTAPAQ